MTCHAYQDFILTKDAPVLQAGKRSAIMLVKKHPVDVLLVIFCNLTRVWQNIVTIRVIAITAVTFKIQLLDFLMGENTNLAEVK